MRRRALNKHCLCSFCLFCVLLSLVLNSCGQYSDYQELAGRIAELEGEAGNDSRIRELHRSIRRVDGQVAETLENVKDKGMYWRLLGLKYMDYKMWQKAIDAFDEALIIFPEYVALIYNRALCASQMALAATTASSRTDYLRQAENGQRRAISIDARYTPALYALAVILVFEKNDYLEAAALLEDYLRIERSDIPARFLLARAYLEILRIDEAQQLYAYIIKNADGEDRAKAQELLRRISGGDYGS